MGFVSDELLRTWGNNVRMFRLAKAARDGIDRSRSMQQMADDLEVSKATLSRWETGKCCPTDSHKIAIATYLDVDVRSLFPLVRS